MSWNDRYYDAVEFFCWEPQHLGKIRNPDSTLRNPKVAIERLRRIEVTLNHHFDFFFDLAPSALINHIFTMVFLDSVVGKYKFFGRNVESNFDLEVNTTQPDLFFLNEHSIVSIELKIKSKSSVNQALKYAFLGLAADLKQGVDRKHYLAFMAPGKFSNLWLDGFQTVDELKYAMILAASTFQMKSRTIDSDLYRPKFVQLITDMSISFINYRDFSNLLQKELDLIPESSVASETYKKLLQGMIDEIRAPQRDIA
jgi:hypothetical protein